MTIFQNKDIGQYRNIRLSKIKKEGNDDFSDSDSQERKPKDNVDKKYVKKLEITIENLNGKLTKAKKELDKVKQENLSLQASIDNHVFINEKLN
jgi:predicted transcriptional regulator